jgi:hypothetical protein
MPDEKGFQRPKRPQSDIRSRFRTGQNATAHRSADVRHGNIWLARRVQRILQRFRRWNRQTPCFPGLIRVPYPPLHKSG